MQHSVRRAFKSLQIWKKADGDQIVQGSPKGNYFD